MMIASRVDDMQTVCMAGVLVQIRDVDPTTRDRLKQRAAEEGVSLNSYLKRMLDRAAAVPSRAEVVRRLQERGNLASVDHSRPDTVELLHEVRAERDRELMARVTDPDHGDPR